jgi:hypothetical protein
MTGRTSSFAVLATAVAAAALVLWLPASGTAVGERTQRLAPLGLVGLAQSQTLRISIAHVVGFDPQPDPPGRCVLAVGFVDAAGERIGAPPKRVQLRAGDARSFELPASRAGAGPHVAVRPVVVDLRPQQRCPAVITSEVVDKSGLTGYIIHWTVAQPRPTS